MAGNIEEIEKWISIDGDNTLRINYDLIQFHPWTENYETRYQNIAMKLSNSHKLTYQYPYVWENWKSNE